jgi:hypothetical protein
MENLTRYEMETCECNDWECDKVDVWPSKEGEWVKFSDVKELLQTANQQLKAKISACLDRAVYSETGNVYIINGGTFNKMRQLSAI